MKGSPDCKVDLPVEAPVMALPGALLFPYSLLPLYIFEDRYRLMLKECLEQERVFCVALVKPGVEAARDEGDFFHVGGLGLIRACIAHADGTSHLILQGMARVRFLRFVQEEPYRIAAIREVPSVCAERIESMALSAKVVELCSSLKTSGLQVPEMVEEHLAEMEDVSALSDIVSHTFVANPFARQQLLEQPNVSERLRLLIRILDAQLS